jgi:hypothetical protein
MQEYPEADVDRIIAEEVMRADGTRRWYGPSARTRITTLLMSRLCAAWSILEVRAAIEATAAAETDLLYLCGTKEVLYAFTGNGYDELIKYLLACDNALGLTIVAHASWPADTVVSWPDVDLRAGLEAIREQWACSRQELQVQHAQGRQVAVHSGVFTDMHATLQVGYMVYLTCDEHPVMETQLQRALNRIGEHHDLFFPPTGSAPTGRPS